MKDFAAAGIPTAEIDHLLQTVPQFSTASLVGMAQGLLKCGVPTLPTGTILHFCQLFVQN